MNTVLKEDIDTILNNNIWIPISELVQNKIEWNRNWKIWDNGGMNVSHLINIEIYSPVKLEIIRRINTTSYERNKPSNS